MESRLVGGAPPDNALDAFVKKTEDRPTGIEGRGLRQAGRNSGRSAPEAEGGNMRSRLFVLPLALVTLMVAAPTASADPPVRFPVVAEPLTLTGVCSFPVRLDAVANHQTVTVFSNGKTVVTGNFVARVTNLDNGKSVTLEASGPLFFTPNADGTTTVKGTGTNIWYFLANQTAAGAPGAVYLVRGLSSEVVDATGTPITGTFTHSGYIESLCDTLA